MVNNKVKSDGSLSYAATFSCLTSGVTFRFLSYVGFQILYTVFWTNCPLVYNLLYLVDMSFKTAFSSILLLESAMYGNLWVIPHWPW